jgi:hypothetical protein
MIPAIAGPIRVSAPENALEGSGTVQRALVEQAQRGDQEAFAALVYLVADRLHAIAFRILRDADRAEDALQQALVEVWRDLPDLRDPERFDAWAYRLVCRASYREARRARRSTGSVRDISAADGPVGGDPSSSLCNRLWSMPGEISRTCVTRSDSTPGLTGSSVGRATGRPAALDAFRAGFERSPLPMGPSAATRHPPCATGTS